MSDSKSLVLNTEKNTPATLKWYEFYQNNSGGGFDYDENIGHRVFIQAYSAREANDIASRIGIYFYGVADDIDCPCCGDRWCPVDNRDGKIDAPMIYAFDRDLNKAVKVPFAEFDSIPTDKDYSVIHYYDGTKTYGLPQF